MDKKITNKEYLVCWQAVCHFNGYPFTSVLKGKLYNLSHIKGQLVDEIVYEKCNKIMYPKK